MRQAALVSSAHTPAGRACAGAFDRLQSPALPGIAIGAEVDDGVIGCGTRQGTQIFDFGRRGTPAPFELA